MIIKYFHLKFNSKNIETGDNMERYNIIKNKNQREIVLLKSRPCFWGKCSFCDYIADNSLNESDMNTLNSDILKNVTGIYKTLEVINSASCFDLPKETLTKIKEITISKDIKKLFFESHWIYRHKLKDMRKFFNNTSIIFKIDRKSTRLNSSHANISYAVFCLKTKSASAMLWWLHSWL